MKILGSIKGGNPLKFSIRKINLAKQIPTKSVALLPANYKAASAISVDPQLFLFGIFRLYLYNTCRWFGVLDLPGFFATL